MKDLKKLRGKPRIERLIAIFVSFVLQIVWLTIVFSNLITYSVWVEVVFTIFSLGMILYLTSKDESPAYRISWIILISLLPLFGGFLYLLIGNKRPTRAMQNAIITQEDRHKKEPHHITDAYRALEAKDPRLAALSRYVHTKANAIITQNNTVEYFPSGESMMNRLLADLRAAEETIFIEFFIVEYGVMFDAIFNILIEKARAGVDVRFLYDDFGSITRLPSDFVERLEREGIQGLCFNPVRPIISMIYNTRDHRKFIIIDSKIGYTGGLNLADEYINVISRFGYWKDNMIRLEGPGVWNYSLLFLNMWNAFKLTDATYEPFYPKKPEGLPLTLEAEGFVQGFGDSPLDNEPVGESVYREILNNAVDYVYIYTPYLIISYELQTAITLAAKRGVDVRLMTPGIPDKKLIFRITRSYYRPLIEAGVKIYEYSPGFLHAKTFVSDNKVAAVGTINLDYRSLYLHFESATLMYYHPVIEEIKRDYLHSQAVSKEIKLEDIKTPLPAKIWEALLRTLAPFV